MHRICILTVGVFLANSMALAEDWPQFHGQNGSRVSKSSRSLPAEFSPTVNRLWSVELGDGIASPIIAAGRVFTTAMNDDSTFAVLAFDARSGAMLWKSEFPVSELPTITPPNSHASSTPVVDSNHAYVYFTTIGIIALRVDDGKEVWRRELPRPAYLMDWGAASSPIVFENKVIFNLDDDLNPYLIALDCATGSVCWKTPRPEMLAGYAIPVVCTANGRTDIVVAGSGKLKGYDPGTGQELWTCNTLLRTIMTSPVVQDDRVYVAVQSYGDASRTLKYALLEWLDTNQDGRLARSEVPAAFLEKFDVSDKDHDGVLEGNEVDHAFQAPTNMAGGGSTIQAIRCGGTGDVTGTHLVWNLENRAPSNMSSPLIVDNRLFVVKKGGISSCFDTADGKSHWQMKRIGNLGEYYASPVCGDGKLYVTGDNGTVMVLASSSQMEVLAKGDLGDTCIASPAIADGRLYFRTREKLIAVGQPDGGQ